MSYSLWTNKTWDETYRELRETFSKWGVEYWSVSRDEARAQNTGVTVSYMPSAGGPEIRLHKGDLGRAVDNFRALYLGIEAIRLNEKRGIGDVIKQHYVALAAPEKDRDPYEILGVRSDAPIEVAEAAWKALVRENHPDKGDSNERAAQLNAAMDRVRQERAGS